MSNSENKSLLIALFSWLVALWTCYIFLGSLFYKFTDAAEPVHIFSTIGDWLGGWLGSQIGSLFAQYGAWVVGLSELLTALVFLSPLLLRSYRSELHLFAGLMAVSVMFGALFFHLFTPLGWIVTWVENGETQIDAGLANAALSIFILNLFVVILNKKQLK